MTFLLGSRGQGSHLLITQATSRSSARSVWPIHSAVDHRPIDRGSVGLGEPGENQQLPERQIARGVVAVLHC